MSDYKTTINFKCSAAHVFEALTTELSSWWGTQDRRIEATGTIFRVSWGEPWYEFEVIKFVRDKEMIWTCTDANQKITGLSGVEKEWVGTQIHWRLVPVNDNNCRLEFKHLGLVPEFLCFDFCSKSWNHFLSEKLVAFAESVQSS